MWKRPPSGSSWSLNLHCCNQWADSRAGCGTSVRLHTCCLRSACGLASLRIHEGSVYFFKLIYFYFWLCWVFVAVRGLSLVAASGGYSSLQCTGFSLGWLLLLQSMGSRRACGLSSCGSWALEHRLSSCGTLVSLLFGTWDLPEPGIEPVSPALAGGFLTTAPPGKSRRDF